ncbi:MAG: hypothetical protein V3S83_02400, partial [Gemmatimonadota bacterium]
KQGSLGLLPSSAYGASYCSTRTRSGAWRGQETTPYIPCVITYTREQWSFQYEALDAESPPQSCPSCAWTGFYGPRGERSDPNVKPYHACKFCGFWQREGEEVFFAIPTIHSCGNGPSILGAPQFWWEVPENKSFDCRWCDVSGLRTADWSRPTPHDDAEHPWRQVPQHLSQAAFKEWWQRNAGRQLPFGYL